MTPREDSEGESAKSDGGNSHRPPFSARGATGLGRLVKRAAKTVDRRIEIDTRSLAAFRIGLAVVLLADLLLRLRNFAVFYTDAGVLPRSALADISPLAATASLHALSGAVWYQALLFSISGAVGVALLIGYRSRLAALISGLLIVSLQLRNPFVLNSGDTVLWNLLFIAALLPIGARWSVDVHRRSRGPHRVANASSLFLLSYPIVVYSTNAAFKLHGEMWLAGDALAAVFALDRLTRTPAVFLAEYPALLAVGTWGWFALISGSAVLLVSSGWVRTGLVAVYVSGHLAMLLTLRIGLFPLLSIVALLPFLPTCFWNALRRFRSYQRLSIIIPGQSGEIMKDSNGVYRGRTVLQMLVIALVVTNVWWQAAAVDVVETPEPVAATVDPAEYTWTMFSPDPPTANHWIEAPAMTANGSTVDGFHPASVSLDRPPGAGQAYPTFRWRKYTEAARIADDHDRLALYADYLCHRAANHYDESITTVRINQVTERPDKPTYERQSLIDHDCQAGSSNRS